jgi:hypothetical protein
MNLFTATDIDGDTITIERTDGVITATITGEDGHRTVILTDSDLNRLASVSNT